MNNEKRELSYIGFKFACLEIRSRNEEAINSTRNRVYSLNSSEIHHICQDGINAEKFEKTRMRFTIDVFAIPAIVIFKALYNHEHDTLAYRKLVWSKKEIQSIMIRWKNCLFYKTLLI